MGLLRYASLQYPERIAVQDEREIISYSILYQQAEQLAASLQNTYNITKDKSVAIMCCNHASLVRSIFALSRLGTHIYLLNAEMSSSQFKQLNDRFNFDMVIYDASNTALPDLLSPKQLLIPAYNTTEASIDTLSKTVTNATKIRRSAPGKVTILTGGTTGDFKTAERKQSATSFSAPFLALVNNLNLNTFSSVYIATPIYHGFGLAALCISVAVGARMFMLQKFDAAKACALIHEHKIEAVTLVPLMLNRMLAADPVSLRSLVCIVSGGAALNPVLAKETQDRLGPVLYNLYGTSEVGFCILATPRDMAYSVKALGKAIQGVQLKLLDNSNNEVVTHKVGRICIKSSWTIKHPSSDWIETGDLAYKDNKGYYFLCGKIDDMIVSGGENVYPIELENILMQHSDVTSVAVIGIEDEDFGQRLKAFVVPAADSKINKGELMQWLSGRAARYQMPKHIEFISDLPYTALGKPDKKQLS